LREEQTRIKEELDKVKKEEEQTDRMLASKLDRRPKDVRASAMPTISKGRLVTSDLGHSSKALGQMGQTSSKQFYAPVPPSVL